MENSIHAALPPALRVLLASAMAGSNTALLGWLWDQDGLVVAGPAATITETLILACRFQPEVVLLDFHGLPVALGHAISLFKELTPTPRVFVLTHELNDAWRDRCGALRADAVFHKTAELDQLAAALGALRLAPDRPSAIPPSPSSR